MLRFHFSKLMLHLDLQGDAEIAPAFKSYQFELFSLTFSLPIVKIIDRGSFVHYQYIPDAHEMIVVSYSS